MVTIYEKTFKGAQIEYKMGLLDRIRGKELESLKTIDLEPEKSNGDEPKINL